MIEPTEDPRGWNEIVRGYSADKLPMLRYHLERRQDKFGGYRNALLGLFESPNGSPDHVLAVMVHQLVAWQDPANAELASYVDGLLSLLLADAPEDPEHPSPRATDELVAAFAEAYAVPGFEQPDPERVRRALNAALKTANASVIVAQGFIVRGETNQSDGYGPSYEVGRYATLEEARKEARGKGVQGDSGTVDHFETVLAADGTVKTQTRRLIARRRTPEGSYLVGFLDFREYEFGVRPAELSPVRPAPTSIMALEKFALGEPESQGYPVASPLEVRNVLIGEPGVWVGLWRRAGEPRWRGEFQGTSDTELDRWLPLRRDTENV